MNILFFLTLFAIAFGAKTEYNTDCGEGLTCVYNSEDFSFTVSGNGAMIDAEIEVNMVTGENPKPKSWNKIMNQIQTIIISEGVTRVGTGAFYQANSVRELNLGKNVKTIGKYSFYGLGSLQELNIPDSLEVIEEKGFSGLSLIKEIKVGTNPKLREIKDYGFQSIGQGVQEEINLVMPQSLRILGGSVFSSSPMKTIDFGAVRIIGKNVVSDCNSLTTVKLSKDVHTIDPQSFVSTNSLTEIIVEEGGKYFKSIDGVLMKIDCGELEMYSYPFGKQGIVIPEGTTVIGARLFSGKQLTEITFPSTIKIIREEAFQQNSFTEIIFNEGLHTVEKNAFRNCHQIQTITFSSTLVHVEKGAFAPINYLKTFIVADGNPYFSAENGILYAKEKSVIVKVPPRNENIPAEYVLPDNVKIIYDGAFQGVTTLTKVTLQNEKLHTIRSSAFDGCTKLEEVIIDAPVKSVGEQVFKGCTKLSKVTIGNDVKMIGQSMFATTQYATKPSSLSVTLGSSIMTIESSAFEYTNIEQIVIPDSCSFIKSRAFYGCSKLSKVTIGSGVISIDENAFASCTNLVEVTTSGEHMWRIDQSAFSGTKLKEITIPSTVEIVNDGSFKNAPIETITYKGEDQPAYCSPEAFTVEEVTLDLHENYPQQEFCGIRRYEKPNSNE